MDYKKMERLEKMFSNMNDEQKHQYLLNEYDRLIDGKETSKTDTRFYDNWDDADYLNNIDSGKTNWLSNDYLYDNDNNIVSNNDNLNAIKYGLSNPQNIIPELVGATRNMYNSYQKYKDKAMNDKDKHFIVSCEGAQVGPIGVWVAKNAGKIKENLDIHKKFQNPERWGGYHSIVQDSQDDWSADREGIRMGYRYPKVSCEKQARIRNGSETMLYGLGSPYTYQYK